MLDCFLIGGAIVFSFRGWSKRGETTRSLFDSLLVVESWIVVFFPVNDDHIDRGQPLFLVSVESIFYELSFLGNLELSLFGFEFADDVIHIIFNLNLFLYLQFFLGIICQKSLFLASLFAYKNF